ncbi:MAG: IS66 family transposase, partial [Phycisphaerae bacterium]
YAWPLPRRQPGANRAAGRRLWTWGFRAASFTCFKIEPSRGSQVLRAILGDDFAGTLVCDYFSAYHKYRKDSGVSLQFCMAHLIRDVKFLATLPEAAIAAYGQRLLEALRTLFHTIHQRKMVEAPAFQQALEQARDNLVAAGLDAPEHKPAQNMAERFRQNGESYFQFITTPGVEPTNNLAEQAIRFVVLDRHVTQGTRSERGRQWCERIWSAIATCT